MTTPTVSCPNCNRSVEWSAASPWRPFCSERCKLIDLGAWFAEERSIPGEEGLKEDTTDDDAASEPR